MTRKSLIKKIEKFNEELESCYETTGDDYLYWVDTTIEGDNAYIGPFEVKDIDGGIEVSGGYGDEYEILDSDYEETFPYQVELLLEDIKYYRRMIKKTLRVWYSENPDSELEKED